MNNCYSYKKRIISVLLCVVLVLTAMLLVPINASAQEANIADISYDDGLIIEKDGIIYSASGSYCLVTGFKLGELPENLVIPSEVDGYTVIRVNTSAFEQAQKLVSVTIPNTVIGIEECAFQNCKNLKSVKFESGSTLKHVMEWGFAGCSSLESITLPASLKSIGIMMFEDCTNLKSVTFEDNSSLVCVGSYAFEDCESLEYINLPATVTEIDERAFINCYSLSKVDIHEGVEKIGDYAFYNCFSLSEIFIPDSVEEIGACALGCFEYEGDIYSNPDFVVVGSPDSLADEYAEAYMVTWEYGISAPKLNTISNTSDGIKLTFEKLSGVSGQYRIYRKTADTSWSKLADVTTASYTDKTAVSGVYYIYTVKFIGYDGTESRYDKNGLSITRLTVPSVTKIQNTEKGVKLTIEKVEGAAYYRVYYKTSDGWKGIDNTDTTTFVHESAKSGESYTYTVKAFDKFENSSSFNSNGWSNTFIATPQITSVTSTEKGVKITWDKIDGAVNYRVYYKNGSDWKGIGNTTSTTFTHTDATPGVKYTYTVRCMKSDGKTAVSDYSKQGKSHTYFYRGSMASMHKAMQKIKSNNSAAEPAQKSSSTLKPQAAKSELVATVKQATQQLYSKLFSFAKR